jgi:hypothetical protein
MGAGCSPDGHSECSEPGAWWVPNDAVGDAGGGSRGSGSGGGGASRLFSVM